VEFVKEKYAISIEDEELVPDHWDSVSRIASFVQSRLGLVEASAAKCGRRRIASEVRSTCS